MLLLAVGQHRSFGERDEALDEVAAHLAADAPRRHRHNRHIGKFLAANNQRVVNRHGAKLVLQHAEILAVRSLEQPINQGCLACAQESGDDGHRHSRREIWAALRRERLRVSEM